MKTYIIISIIATALSAVASSCTKYPAEIENALGMAADNRKSLEKVLRHYSRKEEDSLKYRAACFLIENMRWHTSDYRITWLDPKFPEAYRKTDSIFRSITDGLKISEMTGNEVKTVLGYKARVTKRFFDSTFMSTMIEEGNFPDLQHIDADFLISHIDNAFTQRDSFPVVSKLAFKDFCEYVLPYRSCSHPPFSNGRELNDMFSHYLNNPQIKNTKDRIKLYNTYVYRMKCLSGRCPVEEHIGTYDLFFSGKHDCVGIASHATNVLRANGVPAMAVFYAAHKEFAGRHFHCGAMNEKGKWQFFGPESDLPGEFNFRDYNVTNMFSTMFGAQKDSPYMLRREGEVIPAPFNTPCIKEVTKQMKEVRRVNLPFHEDTGNKMAYLYAFQNCAEGLTPVTWGTIDTSKKEVRFPNVLFDVLYFPVYLTADEEKHFASPFWISKDKSQKSGFSLHFIEELMTAGKDRETVVLTRKFPRKKNMVEKADNMVGGKFFASNDKDFRQARLLYTIQKSPIPYLQEFSIRNPQAYRYYRYVAPEAHPETNVSMLEFMTSPRFGYANTIKALPRTTLKPGTRDTATGIKLVTYPIEKMNRTSWLDGNMTVSSGNQKHITFSLGEPQVVTAIRYAPHNADNGIKRGHEYQLMYWEQGWKAFQEQIAQAEYLEFSDIPANKLYWLRDLTDGKEELPFIIQDGRQLFIYYDIIR